MTSTAVSQLGDMNQNFSTRKSNSNQQNSDFAGVFQSASQNGKPMDTKESNIGAVTKTENAESTLKKYSDNKTISNKENVSEDDNNMDSDKLKEFKEMVNTALREVKEAIAKELNVTEEEVTDAMNALGITDASLLIPANIPALVAALTQSESTVDLLTDPNLSSSVQNLIGNVKEQLQLLGEQLGIDTSEMQSFIEQIQDMNTILENAKEPEAFMAEDVLTESKPKDENMQELIQNSQQDVQKDSDIVSEAEAVSKEGSNVKEDITNEQQTDINLQEEPEAQQSRTKETQNHDARQNEGQNNNSDLLGNSFAANELNARLNQISGEFAQNLATDRTNADEIIRQIADYIKTQVKPEITEIEMQLHPQSLGTVQVSVSAKQGAVTAQFVAQNEAVKAALESQIVVLKENLEEQGIKVDAVEVTIASHEFERNMNEQSNQDAQTADHARKTIIRRINLNEEMNEELSEDEQIAVDMMTANGNTVDYTA